MAPQPPLLHGPCPSLLLYPVFYIYADLPTLKVIKTEDFNFSSQKYWKFSQKTEDINLFQLRFGWFWSANNQNLLFII